MFLKQNQKDIYNIFFFKKTISICVLCIYFVYTKTNSVSWAFKVKTCLFLYLYLVFNSTHILFA